jgi:acetamidase/formamidase
MATATKVAATGKTHHLPADDVHYRWDVDNNPTLAIEPGDTVVVWTRDVSDNQVGPDSDASALANFNWDDTYPLTGPVALHGAEPGDTLKVEILDIHTQGWGWTGIISGLRPASRGLP